MKPAPFAYHRAETLDQALALLDRHGDEARLLAGGQSLVPMLNLRIARFAHLVDINPLHGLDYVREAAGELEIGALTRHVTIERSELVQRRARSSRRPPRASAMSRFASAAPWAAASPWPTRRAICP